MPVTGNFESSTIKQKKSIRSYEITKIILQVSLKKNPGKIGFDSHIIMLWYGNLPYQST